MNGKEIRIPRALHELHGERSTVRELLLVYGTGAAFGVLALLFAMARVAGLPWWKAALLFLVAMDASAGVVANFTPETDRYYAARPRLRWAFLAVHALEPGLLYALFGGKAAWWAFLYGYTAAAAALVNVIQGRVRQETAAAALLALGTLVLLPFGLGMPFLAFAVRRTDAA